MLLFIKKETGGKLMVMNEKRTVINKKKNAITPNKEEKQ